MRGNQDDPSHDLRRWLGEDDTPTRAAHDAVDDPPRRWTGPRVTLVLLVLAPWIVLVALALSGAPGGSTAVRPADRDGTGDPATVQPAGAPAAGAPTPSAAPTVLPGPDDDPTTTPAAPAIGTAPAAVGPTAVRLVRDAVTRSGVRSMALDAAAAEEADPLAAGTWAVRVHAVVLRGDRRRWRTATHEVWVAPVGVRAGRVVGLDRPWRVATIDSDVARTTWRRVDVDTRAVRAALGDAGLDHGDDLVAQRHPTVPSVVRVTVAGRRRVWVRMRPEPVVVGLDGEERRR